MFSSQVEIGVSLIELQQISWLIWWIPGCSRIRRQAEKPRRSGCRRTRPVPKEESRHPIKKSNFNFLTKLFLTSNRWMWRPMQTWPCFIPPSPSSSCNHWWGRHQNTFAWETSPPGGNSPTTSHLKGKMSSSNSFIIHIIQLYIHVAFN